jgi:hypothetical protein
MLGRSKGKPGAARAKARDMAMAQRNKAPTTSGGSSGSKAGAKAPTPAQLEQAKSYEAVVRQALNKPKATSTVAAKPSPKPAQPPKSVSPVLTREQKYQQAQKFGNAAYLNKPEVKRANEAKLKLMEEMATSKIDKAPATSIVAAKTTPSSVNAKKPSPSGIVSSSKEAVEKMPTGSFVPIIPKYGTSGIDKQSYEVMRSAPQPGPKLSSGQIPSGAQSPMGTPPMQAGGAGGLMNQAGPMGMKKGGSVKTFKKGGSVDGCAQRGKTKGRYI